MKDLFQVVAQGEVTRVPSQKTESGQLAKCNIVVKCIGGQYEDAFVATMFGNLANCKFYSGELVYGVLHFSTREYNGQMYQDIVVNEIIKINK